MAEWSDERTKTLRDMWCEGGYSASQIAAELGGVTRNAVIGKAHRLGLACKQRKPTPPGMKRGPKPPKAAEGQLAQRPQAAEAKPIVKHSRFAPGAWDAYSEAAVHKPKDQSAIWRERAEHDEGTDYLPPEAKPCGLFALSRSDFEKLQRKPFVPKCKWPVGDPLKHDSFRFCGAPICDGGRSWLSQYCSYHNYKAKTEQPKRRRSTPVMEKVALRA